jgi:ATP-dependent Zn protease
MLRMPKGCIDVTTQHRGTIFSLVGVGSGRDGYNVTIRRTAYHESGHAVVGRVLNFECGGATITDNGTGSANVASVHSLHWDITRGDILSSVLDKICVCWSGGVAEDIKFGGADDRGDRKQIEALAARYFVQDKDIERARARAHELLTKPKHWDAVERVAAELLNKKTLTGREIDALVHDNVMDHS